MGPEQKRVTVVLKPSRSDLLSPEEQETYLRKAQEYFDQLAPKRTRKPRRSESDDDIKDMVAVPTEIPELKVLAQLQANGQVILTGTATVADADDHVDTGYYKSLSGETEHAILGTGFIPLGMKQEMPYKRELESVHEKLFQEQKGNPATNDWTPAPSQFATSSTKPGRSEN